MAIKLFGRRKSARPVGVRPLPIVDIGRWQLTVNPPRQAILDVSVFRGLPTQLGTAEFQDPFGPSTLTFTFPGITVFDAIGHGELAWLVKEADVDLKWIGPVPDGYPWTGWTWEGYLASWDWGDTGLQVSCVGAMRQSDLELAKPEYPAQPLPYEVAIARSFANRPYLRCAPMRIEWPSWWKTIYSQPPKGTPAYLIPFGVSVGQNWTGLLTRSTGSWDPLLTSYIQTLLTSMYTARGRWTLDLDPGRVPVLRHRDIHFEVSADDVVIDLAQPGITPSITEDWTQSFNVVYAQGTSLSGVGYTGMDVSPDGLSTTYMPAAAARQVEPATDKGGWFMRDRFRRETLLQVQQGLDESQANDVATAHLQRFGDPGITGTVALATDPTFNGSPIPRHLVKAGMTIRMPKLFGSPDGVLAVVTKSSHDFGAQTNTITFDTKYRDALTVDEVRLRGRDSLQIARMLVAGQYQPPVSDQLLPWNYAAGSGYIPGGSDLSALRLFKDMPADITFPWTDWTTTRPPKAAAWRSCYIRLAPASTNADKNWTSLSDKGGSMIGIPIKVSQAGQIRLLQLAAYDENGNVLAVPFHFSLYYSRGVNYQSTPMMPQKSPDGTVNYETLYSPYKAGQHYPFFPQAWESYNNDGTLINPAQASAVQSAGLIRAWGSNYEKAGYWPSSEAGGGVPTGLLVDESQWSFDTTSFDSANFDPYSATANLTNPLAGMIYAMIWCDQQANQEVFFAGRMFRVEPGTGV